MVLGKKRRDLKRRSASCLPSFVLINGFGKENKFHELDNFFLIFVHFLVKYLILLPLRLLNIFLNETIKEGKVSAWSNLLTNHVHNKTLISVDGSQVGVA